MENENVYLRLLMVSDAAISWRWRNDPDIWKYTGNNNVGGVTEEIERKWAESVTQDPTRINYAICLSPSNRYIGNIYLVNIKENTGELGIFIGDKNVYGNGYGTLALKQFMKIVSEKFAIKKIIIKVRPDNMAARSIYEKCGAKYLYNENDWMVMESNLIIS